MGRLGACAAAQAVIFLNETVRLEVVHVCSHKTTSCMMNSVIKSSSYGQAVAFDSLMNFDFKIWSSSNVFIETINTMLV